MQLLLKGCKFNKSLSYSLFSRCVSRNFVQFAEQKLETSEDYMAIEREYGLDYAAIPICIERGEGVYSWDVNGKKYLDCLAGLAVLNQGHCHPKIVEAAIAQLNKVPSVSRAVQHEHLGQTVRYVMDFAGVGDGWKTSFLCSGAEACEHAMKYARRWAYLHKGVPENEAVTLFCENNFTGRLIGCAAVSTNPMIRKNVGPFQPGIDWVPHGNVKAIEEKFKNEPNMCAIMIEGVQGEGGVQISPPGYLQAVRELCDKYNVLMICDEIQCGLGRTGKKFFYNWDNITPDIVIMGKALTGGFHPASCVLMKDEIAQYQYAGTHGGTFGGMPQACAIIKAALDVIVEEDLPGNSLRKGAYCIPEQKKLVSQFDWIKTSRGMGQFMAFDVDVASGVSARQIVMNCAEQGLILKDTRGYIVKISPPLIMTQGNCDEMLEKLEKSLKMI